MSVAVVGLGFGAEFIPLWQKHPHADCYAICQRNEEKLNAVGDYFGVNVRYQDYAALLKDKNVDVHLALAHDAGFSDKPARNAAMAAIFGDGNCAE